jgi:hypothetical protein
MGRRLVTMNEIVEMIYQWHHGKSLKGIHRCNSLVSILLTDCRDINLNCYTGPLEPLSYLR